MNKARFTVLFVAVLTISFSTFITPARADGSFSLTVQGTTSDPLLGKVVNVEGRNKPIITIVPGFSGSFMGFDKVVLRINTILKPDSTWTNTANASAFSPSTYGWDLCAGNDTSARGRYTLTLHGIDAFGGETQKASDEISIKGAFTCSDEAGGSTASLSISIGFDGDNDKSAEVSLYLTDITESELCSTYTVQLKLKNPDVSKGEFCSPRSTTLKSVTWDTSLTPKGTYQLYAVGLNRGSGGNIQSAPVSIEIKENGVIGSVGGGGGGGDPPGGGGTSADLKPIVFDVPDSSRLKGKYGADLIVALRTIILDYLLLIVSILAVIAILMSGLMYISSYGDPAKAEKAKKNLQWAIYGIVVVVLSLVLLTIVGQLLHKIA